MIALVAGEVAVRRADHVVLETSGGVGYRLAVSAETLNRSRRSAAASRCTPTSSSATTRSSLYGFATEEERDLFLMLLGVQGVGPKVALARPQRRAAAELVSRAGRRRRRPPAGRPRHRQAHGRADRRRAAREGRLRIGADGRFIVTRGDDPRRIARDGLLELGFAPAEAHSLLDGAEGATRRGALASALSAARAMTEPPRIHTPARSTARTTSTARSGPAARRVRRPGRHPRAARRLASRPPPRAASRSTTSCCPGRPGLGKTSLAQIVAEEMGVRFVQTAGPALERKGDIAALLTALEPNSVFFVDEIHRLNRALEETFYPAMEDRSCRSRSARGRGRRSSRSTCRRSRSSGRRRARACSRRRCATASASSTASSPTRADDLARIVRRSAGILGIALDDGGALGDRAAQPRDAARRQPPAQARARLGGGPRRRRRRRRGRRRARSTLLEVDDLGLDRLDRDILGALCATFAGGPVGLSTLAIAVGEEADTIEDVYEPYLLQCGLLQRTPRGRAATARAYEHLGLEPPRERGRSSERRGFAARTCALPPAAAGIRGPLTPTHAPGTLC